MKVFIAFLCGVFMLVSGLVAFLQHKEIVVLKESFARQQRQFAGMTLRVNGLEHKLFAVVVDMEGLDDRMLSYCTSKSPRPPTVMKSRRVE